MNQIKYTLSQEFMINSAGGLITKSLKDKAFLEVRIIGSAGTGKTTVMKGLVNSLLKLKKSICITAPTHKALSVIQEKTDYNYSNRVVYKTLASFLSMSLQMDLLTEETVFTFSPKTDFAFDTVDILIVDEASMVPKDQFDKIREIAERMHAVIIWVGDSKQLPPVKENTSLATEDITNSNCITYTLKEIVRQTEGNPIIELSQNLPEIKTFLGKVNSDNQGYFFTMDREMVIQNLAKGGGSEAIKFLSWKNEVVDEMNTSVRESIYGPNPQLFYPGESIIINGSTNKVKNNTEVEITKVERNTSIIEDIIPIALFNRIKDELPITKMKISTESDNLFITDTKLRLKVDAYRLNNGQFSVLHKSSEKYFNQVVKILKLLYKKKMVSWSDVCRFQEKYVKFKYGYALTIHKSQGSTYKNVIIDLKDVYRNKSEYDRMIYTAITRASDRVIFYYKPNEVENNE